MREKALVFKITRRVWSTYGFNLHYSQRGLRKKTLRLFKCVGCTVVVFSACVGAWACVGTLINQSRLIPAASVTGNSNISALERALLSSRSFESDMFIFGNLRLQTRSLCQQHSVALNEWKSSLVCQVAALAGGGRTWQWVHFPGATWRCAFSAPSGESLHWRVQTRRDSPLYQNIRGPRLYLERR